MERGRDKDNEYILHDMIRENEGDEDVVTSFLNESGEGVEDLDRRDGSSDDDMEREADGSGPGTISTTKSSEVY